MAKPAARQPYRPTHEEESSLDLLIRATTDPSQVRRERAVEQFCPRIELWSKRNLGTVPVDDRPFVVADIVTRAIQQIILGKFNLALVTRDRSIEAWVRTIARTCSSNYHRANKTYARLIDHHVASHPPELASQTPFKTGLVPRDAEDAVMRREAFDALKTYLTDAQYAVIYLRHFVGLDPEAIAGSLEISRNAVDGLHNRAIVRLREAFASPQAFWAALNN